MIEMSLEFGPGSVNALREVGIRPVSKHHVPYGKIDLLVHSEDNSTNVGLLSSTPDRNVDTVCGSSVKRDETFPLSEVLTQLADVDFVIMLKACRSRFLTLAYFPKCDFLIRTESIPL